MYPDQYLETVTVMGRTVTLAQLDIALRCATLAVCLTSLAVAVVRMVRGR